MYGKKRIVILKRGEIVLAGGHSWLPIGRAWKTENQLKGSFLNPKNQWERRITPENSIPFDALTPADLRKLILTYYPDQQ
jgi:hypothetical protein